MFCQLSDANFQSGLALEQSTGLERNGKSEVPGAVFGGNAVEAGTEAHNGHFRRVERSDRDRVIFGARVQNRAQDDRIVSDLK